MDAEVKAQVRKALYQKISESSIVHKFTHLPIASYTPGNVWVFDFKQHILNGPTLNLASTLLWGEIKSLGPIQVCGLETTAIALVAGVVLKAQEDDETINGFYIRKSRKKNDLQRIIEGEVLDKPIVIVDDILNHGKSKVQQIELLESIGKKVVAVAVVMRYRDLSYYRYLNEKGIKIISLFTPDDFPQTGGLEQLAQEERAAPKELVMPWKAEWHFASTDPYLDLVIPKSGPVIDNEQLYFGADNGTFWALNQKDGTVAWKFKTLFGSGKKRILSTPALADETIYFGAYDGNVYALDKRTGKKKWAFVDADWVGSSPAVASAIGTIFVGLEFGLWKKQGGLAALDIRTGTLKWSSTIETLVHSSPVYAHSYNTVCVGSAGGIIHAYNAKTGALKWTFNCTEAMRRGFALDEKRGLVCFGCEDGSVYVLNIKTGALVYKIETMSAVDSTPLVHNGFLYVGSTDKRVYCVDLNDGSVRWAQWTRGRVFASPVMIEGSLFIGSNDGKLYELDPENGAEKSFFQATERIVNAIAYNPDTKTFFVPTHANEIYALKRI